MNGQPAALLLQKTLVNAEPLQTAQIGATDSPAVLVIVLNGRGFAVPTEHAGRIADAINTAVRQANERAGLILQPSRWLEPR